MVRHLEPLDGIGKKLEVIRVALRHEYPVIDIGRMLSEIEKGYVTDTPQLDALPPDTAR